MYLCFIEINNFLSCLFKHTP